MGYSATGEPVEDLRPLLRFFMEVSGSQTTKSNYPAGLLYTSCKSLEGQRALAATVQSEFENFLEERMRSLLEHVGHQQAGTTRKALKFHSIYISHLEKLL